MIQQEELAVSADEFAPGPSRRKVVAAGAPISVLLVEDDPEAADLVRLNLTGDRNDPFSVEWSENLAEAVGRLSRPGIDVVLLDLGLPEMSGYRSCRVIESACDSKLPVVILTGDDRPVSRNLTVGLGVSDYLLKYEASPAQLKQSLRNAVRCGRPRLEDF
jgi:two-component system catabolic regulation response regulator CreB